MIYGKDNYAIKIERIGLKKDREKVSIAIFNQSGQGLAEIDLDEHGALAIIKSLSEILSVMHANDDIEGK
jgi:hypothetical protein